MSLQEGEEEEEEKKNQQRAQKIFLFSGDINFCSGSVFESVLKFSSVRFPGSKP